MNEMEEYVKEICNQIDEESKNKNNFRKNELPDAFVQLHNKLERLLLSLV